MEYSYAPNCPEEFLNCGQWTVDRLQLGMQQERVILDKSHIVVGKRFLLLLGTRRHQIEEVPNLCTISDADFHRSHVCKLETCLSQRSTCLGSPGLT